MVIYNSISCPEADALYSFDEFNKYFQVLKPILRLLGVDVSTPEAAFERLRAQIQCTERDGIPDICHVNFAARGWVLYGGMDPGLIRRVEEAVRQGRLDVAEDLLVGHCNEARVRTKLNEIGDLVSRESDWELVQRAFQGFLDRRYDACIPLVLIATDKIVQQVYEQYIDGAVALHDVPPKVRAWESFASYNRGLQWIKAIALEDGRTFGTDLYYRNLLFRGIIRGESDRVVAAKAWTTLFAVGEWARGLERSRRGES